MTSKKNCLDSVMVEALIRTLRSELFCRAVFQNRAEPTEVTRRYIDGLHNSVRHRSVLNFICTLQLERPPAQRRKALNNITDNPLSGGAEVMDGSR